MAVHAADAAMSVIANVSDPIRKGILDEPGGETVVKSTGRSAVMVVPRFCAIATAVTRKRVRNNSG